MHMVRWSAGRRFMVNQHSGSAFNATFPLAAKKILLTEVPLEGKEKKRKKVLLSTKIQAGGDKSKSILDYVDAAVRSISNNQGFVGEAFVTFPLVCYLHLRLEATDLSIGLGFREACGAHEEIPPRWRQ